MVFAPLRCLLTAKQTCFVAGLAIAIIVFVTSSTRSVPVANTDAGHPPSSEELSEPLPLAALGAAGAVDGETCVPICGRSSCAEPEIKYQGISFCSYGRRQSQFLSDISGTDSAVEVFTFLAPVVNKYYCSVAQNSLKDLQGYVDANAPFFFLESNFHLVRSGLNPFGLDVADFSYIAAHEFHVKALQMTGQQRQDLRVLILGSGGGVMTTAMRNFLPTAVVDTVEIDDAMVYAAKEWFCAPRGSQYGYHVQDGHEFVLKASSGSYDFVYVDVFAGDDGVPAQFLTPDFHSHVGRVLKPGGLGAMNFIPPKEEGQQVLTRFRKVLQGLGLFELREQPGLGVTDESIIFFLQKR